MAERLVWRKPAFGGIEPPLLSPSYKCFSAQPYSTHTEKKKGVLKGVFFYQLGR